MSASPQPPLPWQCHAPVGAPTRWALAALALAVLGPITTLPLVQGGLTTGNARNVSFWYAPATYGGADINATLDLLSKHRDTVTSVMVYCGYDMGPGGHLAVDTATNAMCFDTTGADSEGIFPRLAALGIGRELILNSGTNNISDYRLFWANVTNVQQLDNLVRQYDATGLHFDLEPQVREMVVGG